MKKRFLSVVLSLILLFALCGRTSAVEAEAFQTDGTLTAADAVMTDVPAGQDNTGETPSSEPTASPEAEKAAGPDILVGSTSILDRAAARRCNQTTYISIRAMVEALYPNAQVTWSNGSLLAAADGLTMTATPGASYLVTNGRYLYVPGGVILDSGVTLAPVRVLAKALGATITWDAATQDIRITPGNGPILSGDQYYSSSAVYWLSRIISAESGSQPLTGKIAVGTVILNRVNSELFPDTIYNVIFDRQYGSYQFSPVRNGSVYNTPNAASVIAAKLCLDGAREAGQSLFFNATGQSCWASRNRTLVTTIGGHNFYS